MSDAAQHDPERRRYPRLKAKIPVEIRCGSSAAMRTATDEVSLCGCYVETIFMMDAGRDWLCYFRVVMCKSPPMPWLRRNIRK